MKTNPKEHENLINEISDIAKDMCRYLESTPYYETVAAYFHDKLMYVHKTKEWIDPYPTIDLEDSSS